jgi:hypothetical protein
MWVPIKLSKDESAWIFLLFRFRQDAPVFYSPGPIKTVDRSGI